MSWKSVLKGRSTFLLLALGVNALEEQVPRALLRRGVVVQNAVRLQNCNDPCYEFAEAAYQKCKTDCDCTSSRTCDETQHCIGPPSSCVTTTPPRVTSASKPSRIAEPQKLGMLPPLVILALTPKAGGEEQESTTAAIRPNIRDPVSAVNISGGSVRPPAGTDKQSSKGFSMASLLALWLSLTSWMLCCCCGVLWRMYLRKQCPRAIQHGLQDLSQKIRGRCPSCKLCGCCEKLCRRRYVKRTTPIPDLEQQQSSQTDNAPANFSKSRSSSTRRGRERRGLTTRTASAEIPVSDGDFGRSPARSSSCPGRLLSDKGIDAESASVLIRILRDLHRCTAPDERKRTFNQLCLRWHPDKNVGDEVKAKEMFQTLQDNKDWFLLDERASEAK